MEIPAFIVELFTNASIEVIYRVNKENVWNDVLEDIRYVPFGYLENTLHFQIALQLGKGVSVSDSSVMILHDDKPVAVWPLLYREEAGITTITGFGTGVLPPLFMEGLALASKKNIVKECIKILEAFSSQVSVKMQSEDVFLNTNTISDWHYTLVRRGYIASIRYDLFVDLSLDLDKIKSRFRKSYKSLISSGMKTWKVGKLDNDDSLVWEEFRQLHSKAAGRETRNVESWDVHFTAIKNQSAFLIYLRNNLGEMVGGGLFIHSKQECFYGVGAYDRSLFDKPLGHVVQYVAIEEMKERGLIWYKVGTRSLPTDLPEPSEKEISITEFKEGFATDIIPKYLLALPI